MSLKKIYRKNPQIITWGFIGLIIGIISILLLFTPLAMLGIILGLISYITWSFFVHSFCAGCSTLPADIGVGFLILTPILYLIIGLIIGWIIKNVSKWNFSGVSKEGECTHPDV